MTSIRLPVLLAIVALSVGVRLAPYAFGAHHVDPGSMAYPWNFSPILALSLFGGALYASRRLVYLVPLATYLLGDVGIWVVTGRADWALYAGQPGGVRGGCAGGHLRLPDARKAVLGKARRLGPPGGGGLLRGHQLCGVGVRRRAPVSAEHGGG